LHLAVALDGAGWHPAAWRADDARPHELFSARYWVDLVAEAERGVVDFVTIDDSLALQSLRRGVPDDRVDKVRGRLDAVLVASRVAPTTSRIGLVPVATTTHTEPFHISKSIATLDYVSEGRAGVQVRVSSSAVETAQFGRRDPNEAVPVDDLFDEAADFVEVIRRLWDSWEDDAEIRDKATGRFVDRDKLHYIDFEGRFFAVRGPSITPRPPQGQPLVSALAHVTAPYRLAARGADVVYITPHDLDELHRIHSELRSHEIEVGRTGEPLRVFVDLVVFLDERPGEAAARKARLDELDEHVFRSDALVFTGTPSELAAHLEAWHVEGIAGFRLRPGAQPHDVSAISRLLVPVLQARGSFRHRYEERTLRARLGLGRPANRYATGVAR